MKEIPSLGNQELEILKYISSNSPVSVRQVSEYFEQEKSLARTTVLTVMERLRKKGLLSRTKAGGIYQYSQKIETEDLLLSKISDFVDKTLGGSVSPLLAYFIESSKLSKDELKQLKDLADKLKKEDK